MHLVTATRTGSMMTGADLTPSGSEITGVGVRNQGGFLSGLGSLALTGFSRFIDSELPIPTQNPDTAEIARQKQMEVAPPGLGSVFENITPVQFGGLLVAAGLTIALVTGQFRPGS